MSLLTIVQGIAQEAGFPAPGSVVGNSDDTAQLILALANRSGTVLSQMSWQVLQKEYTFSFVAAQASYAFPPDLGFFQDYTAWDRTQFWEMRGSLSAQEWQRYKSGIMSTMPWQRFRVKAGAIYIDPTPSTTDSCVIEYVSSFWVAPTATPTVGTKAAFTVDTDVSLIDEEAIKMDTLWRFLSRKGLAYSEEKDQAQKYIEGLFGDDVPRTPLNFGNDFVLWPPLPNLPISGFGP